MGLERGALKVHKDLLARLIDEVRAPLGLPQR